VVATTVYDEFLGSLNWPLGASIAIILLVANLLIMLSYNRILERKYSKVLG
jgi:putative spermidine/putrescine transport system permease protein